MRAALFLVAAAGCNAVFDIGETGPQDAALLVDHDLDGDGTVDRFDNCPIIPNDQTDRDADGLGDVCDACPSGEIPSPADEDEDGIVDGCDNCPGRENRTQHDTDGDGIGDVCDLLPTAQRRLLFDGFSPPSTLWTMPWSEVSGGLRPTTFPSEMKLPGIVLRGMVNRDWHVEAGVDMDLASTMLGEFGLRLRNPISGVVHECGILVRPGFTTGYNRLTTAGTPDPGEFRFVVPTTTLRATLRRPSPTTNAGIECAWDVVAYSFNDDNFPTAMLEVELSLVATTPEVIRYVDIVTGD